MSKYLVAPLNWGLGHASRCVPLVQRFLDEGHEVILGGDGESLTLLRRQFPKLRYTCLAPLRLRYSSSRRQVWAMLKAMPGLIAWAVKDHAMLRALLREEKIDLVVSDNRFGLYADGVETVYITHQLHIFLPSPWRWLEPLAARLHARIYTHFNKVWVPDYEDLRQSLAGELSHPPKSFVHRTSSLCTLSYVGPLSRFDKPEYRTMVPVTTYETVVVLSGLEPQRTMLEKELLARYRGGGQRVLMVQGLLNRPNTRIKRGNITVVPSMTDRELVPLLLGAQRIIARAGYSTIMDMEALGLIQKAELIPTPGQPEQEYLAFWTEKRTSK